MRLPRIDSSRATRAPAARARRRAHPDLRLAIAAACAVAGATAQACGVCIEDRIAVTYDHAIVTKATARHHVVVFTALDGARDPARALTDLRAVAARSPGVDPASVRVATDPPALSFTLDPRIAPPERTVRALQQSPAGAGARLTLLRVVR